ncbi:hypothetical protein RRG08_012892, partial [Elysia crispata]
MPKKQRKSKSSVGKSAALEITSPPCLLTGKLSLVISSWILRIALDCISDFIAEQFGCTLRDPTEKMFFATAGRGTEMFLATEIQDKIHRFTSGQNSNLNPVFVRDGKVFLNQANSNLNECLQVMISLKSAERVFVAIADYDNSEFMN